jgi:uncharacterized protein (DUF362 family)
VSGKKGDGSLKMKRGEFIKRLIQAGVFTYGVLNLSPGGLFSATEDEEEGEPDLVVASNKSPRNLVREAIKGLGGMKRFVSRGDVVAVKPNMSWDRVPEQAANTNPEVVQEVVRLALDAGAKEVRIFDNTCNDPRRCYARSGILVAVKALDAPEAKLVYVSSRKFKVVNIGGGVLKRWPLLTEALEVDKLINVPILKHHSLTRLTMAMKNMMGIMGGTRGKIHPYIHHALVDLNLAVKSHLVILDAYRVLVSNGPQGGRLEDVKIMRKVVATPSVVSADAFGATLFGLRPEDIKYIKAGHEAGLGEFDLSSIRIKSV